MPRARLLLEFNNSIQFVYQLIRAWIDVLLLAACGSGQLSTVVVIDDVVRMPQAKQQMHVLVDLVRNGVNRAITEHHVEVIGTGAAESTAARITLTVGGPPGGI